MTIKAIETRYKGYRFRSRLEARWAVFFDAIGMPWEYEKEGFDMDGVWYLPDFWLPSLEAWAEIKPVRQLEHDEVVKICSVADCKGQMIYVLAGNPWIAKTGEADYTALHPTVGSGVLLTSGAKWDLDDDGLLFIDCPECGMVSISSWEIDRPFCVSRCGFCAKEPPGYTSSNGHDSFGRPVTLPYVMTADGWVITGADQPLCATPRLLAAYRAARSARFEFGESGAPAQVG